jgi:hypothetical protein
MDDGIVPSGFVMDRDLQKDLLLKMRDCYPHPMFGYPDGRNVSYAALNALLYLHDHGLCEAQISRGLSGNLGWGGATINARGLDFLENDGGLGAILGVVTVKLHAETIRQLIEAKVDQADIPEEEKGALRKHLASLSQTALQAATSDLVRAGLDHVPNAMHWLRTLGGP